MYKKYVEGLSNLLYIIIKTQTPPSAMGRTLAYGTVAKKQVAKA